MQPQNAGRAARLACGRKPTNTGGNEKSPLFSQETQSVQEYRMSRFWSFVSRNRFSFGIVLSVCFGWLPVLWLLGIDIQGNLALFCRGGADTVHWFINWFNLAEPQMAIPPYSTRWMYNAGQVSAVLMLLTLFWHMLRRSYR
jgi:hypothetical protein